MFGSFRGPGHAREAIFEEIGKQDKRVQLREQEDLGEGLAGCTRTGGLGFRVRVQIPILVLLYEKAADMLLLHIHRERQITQFPMQGAMVRRP